MQSDRDDAFAAGMDDFVTKPLRPQDLRNAVQRWGLGAQ
jgi:CheY-like chemotaxis protein